jgi:hypothetical protein
MVNLPAGSEPFFGGKLENRSFGKSWESLKIHQQKERQYIRTKLMHYIDDYICIENLIIIFSVYTLTTTVL